MSKEINTDILGFFDVIKTALSGLDNINKSWIKPSAISKAVHFTHLDRLSKEEKIDFVKNIVNTSGHYSNIIMRGIEIKQQGSPLNYRTKDITLSFKSDEQKRKYFGYKLALMGIEENAQQHAEAEVE